MFSGIVEKQGRLINKERQGKQMALTFQSQAWTKPLKRGESVSVNGVCLTVIGKPTSSRFTVQAVPETLNQTTLGNMALNDKVNLERSLKWGERIGGHFVLGHVDGVGRIARKVSRGKSFSLVIEVPKGLRQHLVSKGSIAVDGISLTIQKMSKQSVTMAIIPHTAKATSLGRKKVGDPVNLEADVISKHLAQLVRHAE